MLLKRSYLLQKGSQQISDKEVEKNMLDFIAEIEQAQADKKEVRAQRKAKKKKRRKQSNNEQKQNTAHQDIHSENQEQANGNDDATEAGNALTQLSNLSITPVITPATIAPSTSPLTTTSSSTTSITNTSSSLSSIVTASASTTRSSTSSTTPIVATVIAASILQAPKMASTAQSPAVRNVVQKSSQGKQYRSTKLYQVLIDEKKFSWPKSLKGNQKDNLRDHLLKLRNWPDHGCDVKAMKGTASVYRLRVGGYRAIFHVDDLNKYIRVSGLNIRKVAYRGLEFKS